MGPFLRSSGVPNSNFRGFSRSCRRADSSCVIRKDRYSPKGSRGSHRTFTSFLIILNLRILNKPPFVNLAIEIIGNSERAPLGCLLNTSRMRQPLPAVGWLGGALGPDGINIISAYQPEYGVSFAKRPLRLRALSVHQTESV
jgi:hypothetical protein